MVKETNASANTRREVDAAPAKQYVAWGNQFNFQRRVLEAKDVKALGAESGKRLVWEQSNGWRVPREDIPLTDDQLAAFLEGDDKFKLVEG